MFIIHHTHLPLGLGGEGDGEGGVSHQSYSAKTPFNGLKGDGDINIPAVSELSKSNNKHNCL